MPGQLGADLRAGPDPTDTADEGPTYLLVGHVTHDLTPNGPVVGGTVTYAAVTAARLGERVAVVTAAAFDPCPALAGARVHRRACPTTTTYENVYLPDGSRRQYLRGRAAPLTLADVPLAWRAAPVVHLAPLAAEIEGALVGAFPGSFVGVTPQGWLRHFAEDGTVSPKVWDEAVAGPVLARADAVVLSEDDVGRDAAQIAELARRARVLAVTRGARGASIWVRGERFESPAFPAREVDPTGAGDVFAAAFFIRLRQTGDARRAAEWANGVASFAVEGVGVSTIPEPTAVLARIAAGARR